jgi:hypothetical protein
MLALVSHAQVGRKAGFWDFPRITMRVERVAILDAGLELPNGYWVEPRGVKTATMADYSVGLSVPGTSVETRRARTPDWRRLTRRFESSKNHANQYRVSLSSSSKI